MRTGSTGYVPGGLVAYDGAMARVIREPTVVPAAGEPPKVIMEYVGRVNTGTAAYSLARMSSPPGWREPGQTPEFEEVTLVLEGSVVVETRAGTLTVAAGEAVVVPPGEWVRYSTPDGAEYVSLCVPAFSPETVHRDEE